MTFRLLVVPGVVIDRWRDTWAQRRPETPLELVPVEAAEAEPGLGISGDAALLRLPVDKTKHHAIPLYSEQSVVLAHRDHAVHAADELTMAELLELGEPLLRPLDDVLAWETPGTGERPATTAEAVEWVAAEAGLLVVPQSLARLYHRRDVKYKPVTDAPGSSVALAWPIDGHSELVEEMIGIVRGRSVNSTRGQSAEDAKPARAAKATPKKGPAGRAASKPARRPR
ncbi:LysR substrate-binding domain-containing protein [Dactylosporangium sp. NPDC049140]|uniref:LysR substrate-binding domain-containing protein n=1 Tax=Dactylosporangium sp. NPDC049140 TaxID=3155647 RepID=UPI0033DB9811